MTTQEIVGLIVGISIILGLPAAIIYFFYPLGTFEKRRLIKAEKLEKPTIIKAPKLLPTTCERCGCVYQAKWQNVFTSYHFDYTKSNRGERYEKKYTSCPLCGLDNPVVVECKESEVKADESYSIPKTDKKD